MRTGRLKAMWVALSPTSTTLSDPTAPAEAPKASATCRAVGPCAETYRSRRPSAGIDMAVAFGGIMTSANEAVRLTATAGNQTVLHEASAESVALDRSEGSAQNS